MNNFFYLIKDWPLKGGGEVGRGGGWPGPKTHTYIIDKIEYLVLSVLVAKYAYIL